MNTSARRLFTGFAALAVASAIPVAVDAQEEVSLEEIVVTAQKREQSVLDIPIAISVLDADEIKAFGATSLSQMQATVPSLVVSGSNGAEVITIRGISPPGSTLPTVSRYVDDMSVNAEIAGSGLGFPLVDIARVEVLKGPQGTLYGDGAIGGVVRYITVDPIGGGVNGNMELNASSVHGGTEGYRANISANLISTDTFGLRGTVHTEQFGGWIDNLYLGEDHNESESSFARLKAAWKPNDRFRADFLFQTFESELMPASAYLDTDFVDQFLDAPTAAVEYDLFNLRLEADLGFANFVSSTGYVDNTVATANDITLSYAPFVPLFFPTLDVDNIVYWVRQDQSNFTQEFRFSSTNDDSRWYWTAGVWYRDAENSAPLGSRSYPDQTPVGALEGSLDTGTEAFAIFGEVEFAASENVDLIFGLRRYEDERYVNNLTTGFGLGFAQFTVTETEEFDSNVFRAALNWRYTDGHMAYISASEGFRSGNFQFIDMVAFGVASTNVIEPEELITYEVGAKGEFESFQYEAALFFSDYDNIQVYFPNPLGIQAFDNGGKAEVLGLELATIWNVSDDFSLRATYGKNDTEYKEAGLTHLPGDPMDLIPDYTFSLMTDWDFAWGSSTPGFLRLDYLYVGEKSNSLRGFNFPGTDPVIFTEPEKQLNVRVGAIFNDNYTLTAYVQNATNERGIIGAPAGVLPWHTQQHPRTWGVTFTMDFGQ